MPRVTRLPAGAPRGGRLEKRASVSLLDRLLWRGYRKPLGPKDFWSLEQGNSSEELVSRLEQEWRRSRRVAQR